MPMPTISQTCLVVIMIFLGMMAAPLRANYLTNTDFKDGIGGWHGEGDGVFLADDGTEAPIGTPVIKILLSRGNSHSVYQEFETRDKPTSLHVKVDVFASSDFKRSKYPQDYSINWKPGSTWYWTAIAIPNVDFWIRGGGSGWFYKLASVKPGAWETVEGDFEGLPSDGNRVLNFCVPPGEGAIYIKNPSVDP